MTDPRQRGRLLTQALTFVRLIGTRIDPPSVERVAAELGCSRRTAYRWLDGWRSLGNRVSIGTKHQPPRGPRRRDASQEARQ